jgi:hypothetical protein
MENAPVISPIILLLRSRKFLLAVVGIVLDVLVALDPNLAGQRDALLLAITTLIGVLIGGISFEDGKEKSAPTTVNTGSGDVAVNSAATPPTSPPLSHLN